MKKIVSLLMILILTFALVGCDNNDKDPTEGQNDEDVFLKLIEAEDLSGISEKTARVITEDGSLGLPTEYQGVKITYSSRQKDIISDDGVVTRPSTCWIESRKQNGEKDEKFKNLNDNWPVVVDVTFSYKGQTRTGKLMFIVAPREGFTCDKYKG